jgi:hypothetical protein
MCEWKKKVLHFDEPLMSWLRPVIWSLGMQEFFCNHFFPKSSNTIQDSLYISEDEYYSAHCELFSEARSVSIFSYEIPSAVIPYIQLDSITGLQYKLHLDKYNIKVKYHELRDKN